MAVNGFYIPTMSQQQSAALHLERRSEWRGVRINGVRYLVVPSGRSEHVYHVRMSRDGQPVGCGCRWYLETGNDCSHMVSVRRAAGEAM